MVWVVGKTKEKQLTFEQWYNLLKQYYEEYGNLLVPANYKTLEGNNLHQKISDFRKAYKNNKLTPEQIEKLESIGMVWKIGKSKEEQMTFDEWYELLKQYYEEHGDLLVPSYYETSDEKKIGKNIQNLRKAYKNNKLTPEQITKLESIGMVWNTRDNKIIINYVNTSGIQSLNKNLEDDNKKIK